MDPQKIRNISALDPETKFTSGRSALPSELHRLGRVLVVLTRQQHYGLRVHTKGAHGSGSVVAGTPCGSTEIHHHCGPRLGGRPIIPVLPWPWNHHAEFAWSSFRRLIVPLRPWDLFIVEVMAMGSRCFVCDFVNPFIQHNGFLYFWWTLVGLEQTIHAVRATARPPQNLYKYGPERARSPTALSLQQPFPSSAPSSRVTLSDVWDLNQPLPPPTSRFVITSPKDV